MRKKIFVLAVLTFYLFLTGCCLFLTGCGTKVSTANDAAVNGGDRSIFVLIENGINYRIVYQHDTKVIYAISNGVYNGGNFTVMVDEEGKPLLYKEATDE